MTHPEWILYMVHYFLFLSRESV
uniref:Uncharacterized protein n=1 Tax=Arundo donax TaxID=35708 RepID=A0A0A9BDQ3_ARUDO